MIIKMSENKADNTFSFDIFRDKKSVLSGKGFPAKEDCLRCIERIVHSLKTNNILNINSADGGFSFSISKVNSIVFKTLEEASDGLGFLKESIEKVKVVKVGFKTNKQLVVSRKRLGEEDEQYDYKQASIMGKGGFELVDKEGGQLFYFHFNDAKGTPVVFSRAYDGKKRRLAAVRSIQKDIKDKKERVIIIADRNGKGGYIFILKTEEDYEIARSRGFKEKSQAESALVNFKKAVENNSEILKAPKTKDTNKKKDKKKSKKASKKIKKKAAKSIKSAKEKFSITKNAPIGTIGFEVFKDPEEKLYYFHYHDEQGQALIASKAFSSRKERAATLQAVLLESQNKRRYEMKEKKQQHYFYLLNEEGVSMARSRYFQSQREMIEGMRHLHANAKKYANRKLVVSQTIEELIPISLNKPLNIAKPKAALKKEGNDKLAKKDTPPPRKSAPKPNQKVPEKTEKKETPPQSKPANQSSKSTTRSTNRAAIKTAAPPVKQEGGNGKGRKQKTSIVTPPKQRTSPDAKSTKPSPKITANNLKNTKPNQPRIKDERKPLTKRQIARKKAAKKTPPPLKEVRAMQPVSTNISKTDPYRIKYEDGREAPPRIPPKGDKDMQGTPVVRWIVGAVGLLSLVGLLFLAKSCAEKAKGSTIIAPIGQVKSKVTDTKAVASKSLDSAPTKTKIVTGAAGALEFEKGSLAARITDFLSLADSRLPQTFFLDKIYFPYNQDSFDEEGFSQLNNLVQILTVNPTIAIQISGHTDDSGTSEANLALSEKRATLVKDYLIDKGIAADRVSAKGYGETRPVTSNETDEGRQRNRRSEIVLLRR